MPNTDEFDLRRHLSQWGPVALEDVYSNTLENELVDKLSADGPYIIERVSANGKTARIAPYPVSAEYRAQAAATDPARKRKGKTVVIPIVGVVTPFGASPLMRAFGISSAALPDIVSVAQAAANDDEVSRIVYLIHSGGGSTFGVREAAKALREVSARKQTVAHVNFVAASAAYWLASTAREIVASPSALVGSVGVAISHVEFSRADEMAGITVTHISKPESKRDITSDKPLSETGRRELERLVGEEYDAFAADISKARGVDMAVVGDEYGRIVPSRDALKLRMIDRVMSFGELLSEARASDDLTATRRERLAILNRKKTDA